MLAQVVVGYFVVVVGDSGVVVLYCYKWEFGCSLRALVLG